MKGTNTKASSDIAQNWVTEIQQGNQQMFEQIYLDHRQAFMFWAKEKFDLQEEELIDMFQYAVVALYENVMSEKITKPTSSLKTYLFGIAKNLILKRHRHQRVKLTHAEVLREHLQFQLAERASQEEQLEELVMKVLKNMKYPCKTILQLFYFENRSMTEIAERLGHKNSDVSKSQKRRCIKTLQKKIYEHKYGG